MRKEISVDAEAVAIKVVSDGAEFIANSKRRHVAVTLFKSAKWTTSEVTPRARKIVALFVFAKKMSEFARVQKEWVKKQNLVSCFSKQIASFYERQATELTQTTWNADDAVRLRRQL